MRHDYDVVVIGARVAGASTAMLLARQGHRVLLLDRATMPRDTLSTHAILRSGVLQLTRWGVLDRILKAGTRAVRTITLGFGDDHTTLDVAHEFGIDALYAPRRILLDWQLIQAATDAGAAFADRTQMDDVLRDHGGRVKGVTVSHGGTMSAITAPVVIGADGAHSRLADLVDAHTIARHEATNSVHYAYYTGIDTSGFLFQFTPGASAGLITTNDAVLAFAGRRKEGAQPLGSDPDEGFCRLLGTANEDLGNQVAAGERISRFHGTRGVPGIIRQPFGPGWALVGDAACTMDPIAAYGISNALRDAELCARAVDASLRDPATTAQAMANYRRMRDRLSWPMFRQAQSLAAYQWSAAEASDHLRKISELVRQECAVLMSLPDWPAGVPGMPA